MATNETNMDKKLINEAHQVLDKMKTALENADENKDQPKEVQDLLDKMRRLSNITTKSK